MTASKAIHLLWQLLPASYGTAVAMNGLGCFATHAWTDQLTLCCLIPLRRLYRFILASERERKKKTLFDWKYFFARTLDLFMYIMYIHNGIGLRLFVSASCGCVALMYKYPAVHMLNNICKRILCKSLRTVYIRSKQEYEFSYQ